MVAEVLARAGDVALADNFARTMTDPESQAVALVYAARQVATSQACPMLAQALRLDAWRTAAHALVVHAPDVLTTVVDDLLAEQPAPSSSDAL